MDMRRVTVKQAALCLVVLIPAAFICAIQYSARFGTEASPPGGLGTVSVPCPYTFCGGHIAIPSTYHVRFTVTLANGKRDSFDVAVFASWAPQGALHFWQLVNAAFFDKNLVFRNLPWMAQFGLNNYPANEKWITVCIHTTQFTQMCSHVLTPVRA
jgi:hypothetical protein